MALLKKLFDSLGRKKEVEEARPEPLPAQEQEEIKQEEEKPEEQNEEELEMEAEEEIPQRPAVTMDMVANSIENCKANLINCNLTPEETDKYSAALTMMQQAIRGLHAQVDVSDLLDMLNQVYSSSFLLILNCGTPLERDKAVKSVTEAIKAIPSAIEGPVKIATLNLAILIQTALKLSSGKTISDLEIEREEYIAAEKQLLLDSRAQKVSDLSAQDKRTFDQYEQQRRSISQQIEGAQLLISSYNQEITSLMNIIRTIQINPGAVNILENQKRMEELRRKMPGMEELINLVETAGKKSDEIRAKVKAQIKEMEKKIDNFEPILDQETEDTIDELLSEIYPPKEEKAAETQQEIEAKETPQENEQPTILTE